MPMLPLKEKPFLNVESIGNSVALETFFDADKDDFMNNKARKGLELLVDLGTGYPIDGIYNPIDADYVLAFSSGRLFKIDHAVTTEITGVTINGGTPVKMADFGNQGFFCNDSRIVKWVYADATCAFIADADAPTNATHLGFIDQYLVALIADSAQFEWSDVNDPDTWLGEYATAESRPDNAVALVSAFGEIFIPGSRVIENWVDSGDPVSPFQRIPGTSTERGSISPYSFAQIDNSYMFLDSGRRVIRMLGREPQVISNPFDAEFQALDTITDAIGINFNAGGDTKYILTFPTADQTFVYDYKLDVWSKWSYWQEPNGVRRRWLGNCGCMVPTWNQYLVGSKTDGKIYIAGDYDDDAGNTKQTEIITGRIDWGTSKRKSCNRLRVKVKRGTGGLSTSQKIIMNYRDNGKMQWSHDKVIDLGIAGDNESYKTFRNLKTYRDRQWRFRGTSTDLLLVSAEEDFTVV